MNYPSVTTVLQPYGSYDHVDPEVLARAADRGKRVHDVAAALGQGFYVPVSEECAGYILSFKNWFYANVKEVVAVEREYIHPTRRYIGHPDIVFVHIEDFIAVVDYKTPVGLLRPWACQCVGYLELIRANGIDVKKAGSLRLDPMGGPAKMQWYDQAEGPALAAFLGALTAWHYLKGR